MTQETPRGNFCNRIFRCAALAALSLAFLVTSQNAAHAQILYGSITGSVTDKTGAVVANAAITLTNQDTGEKRSTQTNADGVYNFPDIIPGSYTVALV